MAENSSTSTQIKSWKSPEMQKSIWGFEPSPTSYWRVLGDNINRNPNSIYQDVLRTGQIRGTESYARDAYFAYGAPQGQYLPTQNQALNKNFIIEATKDFNPNSNPLYKNNIYNPTTSRIIVNGVSLPSLKDSMEIGSRWQTPETNQAKVQWGTYSTLAPEESTRFIDRINPANQRNLRMGEMITGGYSVKNPIGFTTGTPDINWKFDYTKPFFQTDLATHAKNATHIAKTVAAQPETKAVLGGAGKVVKAGVGTAGLVGYTAEFLKDPVRTAVAYGVPFTPLRYGVGAVNDLGKGSDLESRGRWIYPSDGGEPRFVRYE